MVLSWVLLSFLLLGACTSTMPERDTPITTKMLEPSIYPSQNQQHPPIRFSMNTFNMQAFREVIDMIADLDLKISQGQYEGWVSHLSASYMKHYNSPEMLHTLNQYPQLMDNGIILKDLEDFFQWVVVPSRSQAILEDIVFFGENQVVAYTSYEGEKAKLYELVRLNGVWKITI